MPVMNVNSRPNTLPQEKTYELIAGIGVVFNVGYVVVNHDCRN